MNKERTPDRALHFKSAQIAGVEAGPAEMAQVNRYALSPLRSEDVFAFKVSMASNEVDRDYEVFPRSTLAKLASLFVGKTVVKDHEHKSDNQIARIFATELVESDLSRMTKAGEAYTELVAKCYMVKTSRNADLIAEIQAGIRKEVSLGCRVDKAICSICGTDNVKTYCDHFPGRRYNSNQLCYFSLENASDAYELSFVAVPAQPNAGTVKSYGKRPCHEEEMKVRERAAEKDLEALRSDGGTASSSEKRLTVNQAEKPDGRHTPGEGDAVETLENERDPRASDVKADEDALENAARQPDDVEKAMKGAPDSAPGTVDEKVAEPEKGDEIDAKEMLKQLHEIAQQLLAFQKSLMPQGEAERPAPTPEAGQGPGQAGGGFQAEPSAGGQTVSQEGGWEGAAASEEAAAKDKAAQARLRALDLALSLRKRSN